MDLILASANHTDIIKESVLSSSGNTCTSGDKPSEVTRSGGTEILSDASSSPNDDELELPKDIPDGPQFSDLAAHINLVVDSLTTTEKHVESPPSLNGFIQIQSPSARKRTKSHVESPHAPLSPIFPETAVHDDFSQAEQNNLDQDILSESCKSDLEGSNIATNSATKLHWDVESKDSIGDCPEATQMSLFSDDIKPFAFFPTEGSSGTKSDQWAWSQTVEVESILPANDDSVESACLVEGNLYPSSDPLDAGAEGDEDFGEFEGCQPISTEEAHKAPYDAPAIIEGKVNKNGSILGRLLEHLEPTLTKAFEISATSVLNDWLAVTRMNESNSDHPSSDIKTEQLSTTAASTARGETTFWGKLFTQGRAHDLRQQWSKSLLYDSYLRSVNIDIRSAMPAFASQLRLLEPVRLGSSNSQVSYTTINGNPVSNTAGILNSSLSPSDEQDTTAPEFDWNSSGLTNPFGVTSTTDESLDLDYFEIQSDSKTNIISDPKNTEIFELERELFSTVPQPPTSNCQHTTQPVLTQAILQPQPSTNTSESKVAAFSSTIRAVISKLPKLRYMRARSLIFPIPETGSS